MPSDSNRFSWLNLTANGNISPSLAVVGVSGAGNALKCVQASTAGTLPPLGVTREATRFPPGDPANDGFIAIAGEPVQTFGPGDIGNWISGAAISDASLPLTYDNQGRCVTVAGSGGGQVWCFGWPKNTVAGAGLKVEVQFVIPFPYTQPA